MDSTKKNTITITKRDFDRATKQDWSARTCVLAQASIRAGFEGDRINHVINKLVCSYAAEKAMDTFDAYFRKPGDEVKPELRRLRASLPIKVICP